MQSQPHTQFDDEAGAQERSGSGLRARARVGLFVGALIAGYILWRLGGGFPPQAWKAVLATLTGQGVPPAHMDLVLIQAVVLLVAWLLLVLVAFQVVRPGRRPEEDVAVPLGQPQAGSGLPAAADLSPRQQWQISTAEEMRLWQSRQSPPATPGAPPDTSSLPVEREEVESSRSQPVPSTFGSIPFPRQTQGEGERASAPRVESTREQEQGERRPMAMGPASTGVEQSIPVAVEAAPPVSSAPVAQTALHSERGSLLTSSASGALERLAGQGSELPGLSSLTMDSSRSAFAISTLPLDPTAVFQDVPSEGLYLAGWACCHPGFFRRRSATLEDVVLAMTGTRFRQVPPAPFSLIVLADGIRGYEGQQTTSQLTSLAVSEALLSTLWKPARLDQEAIKTLLTEGVQYGNSILYERNQRHGGSKIATITVVLILGTTVYIANVGDNRAYFYREGEGLVQITFDHSAIEPLLEQGRITPEEVFGQAKETHVKRVLGNQPSVQVDVFALLLQREDLLLLCSDGLWKLVRKARFQQLVEHLAHPTALPELLGPALVQAALEAGGYDHLSSVVVQARPLPSVRAGEGGASRS